MAGGDCQPQRMGLRTDLLHLGDSRDTALLTPGVGIQVTPAASGAPHGPSFNKHPLLQRQSQSAYTGSVLSQGCWDRRPQTGVGLRTKELYSLTVPWPGRLKPRCQQGPHARQKHEGENPCSSLANAGRQHPRWSTLPSLPRTSRGLLLCVCVSSHLLERLVIEFRVHLNSSG